MGSGAEAEYPFSPATVATIRVTAGDEMNKTMLLGLRLTRKGLRAEDFRARFGIGLEEKYDGILQKLRARRLMDWDVRGVRPTKQRRMPGDIVLCGSLNCKERTSLSEARSSIGVETTRRVVSTPCDAAIGR